MVNFNVSLGSRLDGLLALDIVKMRKIPTFILNLEHSPFMSLY
jgi:hypothetical protein